MLSVEKELGSAQWRSRYPGPCQWGSIRQDCGPLVSVSRAKLCHLTGVVLMEDGGGTEHDSLHNKAAILIQSGLGSLYRKVGVQCWKGLSSAAEGPFLGTAEQLLGCKVSTVVQLKADCTAKYLCLLNQQRS